MSKRNEQKNNDNGAVRDALILLMLLSNWYAARPSIILCYIMGTNSAGSENFLLNLSDPSGHSTPSASARSIERLAIEAPSARWMITAPPTRLMITDGRARSSAVEEVPYEEAAPAPRP